MLVELGRKSPAPPSPPKRVSVGELITKLRNHNYAKWESMQRMATATPRQSFLSAGNLQLARRVSARPRAPARQRPTPARKATSLTRHAGLPPLRDSWNDDVRRWDTPEDHMESIM